jgi:dihydrofolate reductase
MSVVFVDLGVSLDGFVAGPNAGPGNALGDGGSRIQRWQYEVAAWQERLGGSAGGRNLDNDIASEKFERAGAYVMGRRMFDEGEVGWPDPPPFRAPVFVLTHSAREPWVRQGGTTFTFVTSGIAAALDAAKEAAGAKDVHVAGGANVVGQALNAGLVDQLQLHIAPVLLGDGVRLFDGVDAGKCKLEIARVAESPHVTHVWYRVVR